jgi:hypothetical protein
MYIYIYIYIWLKAVHPWTVEPGPRCCLPQIRGELHRGRGGSGGLASHITFAFASAMVRTRELLYPPDPHPEKVRHSRKDLFLLPKFKCITDGLLPFISLGKKIPRIIKISGTQSTNASLKLSLGVPLMEAYIWEDAILPTVQLLLMKIYSSAACLALSHRHAHGLSASAGKDQTYVASSFGTQPASVCPGTPSAAMEGKVLNMVRFVFLIFICRVYQMLVRPLCPRMAR